jgi:anti-anti-sigma factor
MESGPAQISGVDQAMAEVKLNFEAEDINGVRLIHVSGPLDSATYGCFRDYLDPLISKSRVSIVLDCQNLTYVNSRGITLLMHYQRTAKLGFSYFGLAAFRPHTLKSIEKLGLGKFLTWFPTLDEALERAVAM